MSFISNIYNNLSDTDKNKVGATGTKINKPGSHLLTVKEAFEIGADTGMPRFVLTLEDAEGKTIDWTGFLTNKVGKKDGVVQAGEYSVNGIKTYLSNEGDVYDNLRTIGAIKNLWIACGLDTATFGQGIVADTKVYAKAGTKAIESWTSLVGKKLTGVTSTLITLDQKGDKAWRNQKLNDKYFFNEAGLSDAEVKAGLTEPKLLLEIAKEAEANPEIEFKNKNNKICMQELALVKGATATPVATPVSNEEDPF